MEDLQRLILAALVLSVAVLVAGVTIAVSLVKRRDRAAESTPPIGDKDDR